MKGKTLEHFNLFSCTGEKLFLNRIDFPTKFIKAYSKGFQKVAFSYWQIAL